MNGEDKGDSKLTQKLASEEEERSTLLGPCPKRAGEELPDAGELEADGDVIASPSDENSTVEIPNTAHQISQDSWLQVGFVLTTGMNSAYVLGYSGTIMAPLGWVGGVVGLILATAVSLYANALVAKLHEFGGRRHIRYRDLAGFIYGGEGYNITWGLQYVNLFMINVGFVILAGHSLKAVYVLFRDDHAMRLPHFIGIAGLVCGLFAICVPHLSALGVWLAFSMFLCLVYFAIAFALALKDGIEAPPRDYSIHETVKSRIFTTVGALANLFFAFNTGMLPEIQATVRPQIVGNMMKALYFQFTLGALPLFAVTFIGYWAYGFNTSAYLLNSVSGPIWLKAIANISAFLQTIVALHIFASPMYEYVDTKYCTKGSTLAFRVIVRGSYMAITTLVSALLPFLGDFMSLTGALSTIPLTFVLANHMYLVARRPKLTLLQRSWHWFNVILFGCVSAAATVAALRLIAEDSRFYHFFADL